jgi:hypothetical protein
VDVVRDKRQYLPDFLLTTVEVAGDDSALELQRFLAVPTTGWHQLNNGHWVFVLPNTPKYAADLPAGELAIFQSEHLHLTHGIAVAGTLADWYEQIAEPFTGNSNVVLAVGVALSGPLIVWGGVPPGLFHIFEAGQIAGQRDWAIGVRPPARPQ